MLRIFLVIIVVAVGINYYVSAKGYSGPKSDHFDGTRFHNLTASTTPSLKILDEPTNNMGFWDFIIHKFKASWKEQVLPSASTIPAKKVLGKEIVVTFINHSTLLIQTEGLNILTDPTMNPQYVNIIPFFCILHLIFLFSLLFMHCEFHPRLEEVV